MYLSVGSLRLATGAAEGTRLTETAKLPRSMTDRLGVLRQELPRNDFPGGREDHPPANGGKSLGPLAQGLPLLGGKGRRGSGRGMCWTSGDSGARGRCNAPVSGGHFPKFKGVWPAAGHHWNRCVLDIEARRALRRASMDRGWPFSRNRTSGLILAHGRGEGCGKWVGSYGTTALSPFGRRVSPFAQGVRGINYWCSTGA